MSDLQMGKYCEAKNLVLTAMFDPDVPVRTGRVKVTFDGDSITVETVNARQTFESGRDGIEGATMTVAFVMAQ